MYKLNENDIKWYIKNFRKAMEEEQLYRGACETIGAENHFKRKLEGAISWRKFCESVLESAIKEVYSFEGVQF